MMLVTENDIQILALLAKFYVLTREQIQRLCAPHLVSGRSLRRRIMKLRQDGYLFRHRVPVALPGKFGAAPVYYLTKKGTELLASWFDDEHFLATKPRHPRVDHLNHWYAIIETRIVIEQAIALQDEVNLERWVNEWETANKSAHENDQFYLHTKLNQNPPLSCSPDAAFVLSLHGHKKVE